MRYDKKDTQQLPFLNNIRLTLWHWIVCRYRWRHYDIDGAKCTLCDRRVHLHSYND